MSTWQSGQDDSPNDPEIELQSFQHQSAVPQVDVVGVRPRSAEQQQNSSQNEGSSSRCVIVECDDCPCSTMDSGKKCMLAVGVILGLLVGSAILLALSIRRLESYEIGLKYHMIRKDLEEEYRNEGLHPGEPGFEFVIFPNVFRTLRWDDFRCVNFDGVDIIQDLSFQYKIRGNKIYDIVLEFKDFDGYLQMIRNIADTVIHEACSHFNTSEFQSAREQFQIRTKEIMLERLATIGTDITDLQVNDIRRPYKFESAIREKEAAKESIEVAKNERPKLLTEARTKLLEAAVQAEIYTNKAQADAEILITKANAEAEAIKHQYNVEAQVYSDLQNQLSLSSEALLSYLATEVVTSQENGIHINLDGPAATSYTTR